MKLGFNSRSCFQTIKITGPLPNSSFSPLPKLGHSISSPLQVKRRLALINEFRYSSQRRLVQTTSKVEPVHSKLESTQTPQARKRKGKNSLRRVAVEAQRSRDTKDSKKSSTGQSQIVTKTVRAYCAAEEYDIARVSEILHQSNYKLDPYRTELYPQVVHFEISYDSINPVQWDGAVSKGDIFVFPSGAVVGWAVSRQFLKNFVLDTLSPAAHIPHSGDPEEEYLEFFEDPSKENSNVKGDTIIIGTNSRQAQSDNGLTVSQSEETHSEYELGKSEDAEKNRKRDAVLAKIAFSSGLAKSTKLAVLESQLSDYFQTTKSMVEHISRRDAPPLLLSRSSVLSKTGQLLRIRAQLNLYSELTDSLPDLFWDSRSELGLEGYYDEVGRALDTNIRVKELNEKMNYAQQIADVLRETLSERHSFVLEWIIIVLIAVEIMFEMLREYRYRRRFKESKNSTTIHGSP